MKDYFWNGILCLCITKNYANGTSDWVTKCKCYYDFNGNPLICLLFPAAILKDCPLVVINIKDWFYNIPIHPNVSKCIFHSFSQSKVPYMQVSVDCFTPGNDQLIFYVSIFCQYSCMSLWCKISLCLYYPLHRQYSDSILMRGSFKDYMKMKWHSYWHLGYKLQQKKFKFCY